MKVAIIVPYFGKLPDYFSVWLDSVKFNLNFDFLIFTDDKSIYEYSLPDNVRVNIENFEDFKSEVQSNFNFKIKLEKPYKICDYRPAFGLIFKRYLKQYDFWGWCDLDMIFGNLNKFITNTVLEKYDRIYEWGALSLYRNNDKMNHLFERENKFKDCPSYKLVFKHNLGFYFDEVGTDRGYGYGQSVVINRLPNTYLYKNSDLADINPMKYKFELFHFDFKSYDYFEFKDGKIYGINKSKKDEFVYVHFQKRNIKITPKLNKNNFYIGPTIISSDLNQIYESLLDTYQQRKYEELQQKRMKQTKFKELAPFSLLWKIRNKINYVLNVNNKRENNLF